MIINTFLLVKFHLSRKRSLTFVISIPERIFNTDIKAKRMKMDHCSIIMEISFLKYTPSATIRSCQASVVGLKGQSGLIYHRKTSLPAGAYGTLLEIMRTDLLPPLSSPYPIFFLSGLPRFVGLSFIAWFIATPCRAANIFYLRRIWSWNTATRAGTVRDLAVEIYAKILKALAGELSICN